MSANNERFFQMMLIALTVLIVLAVSQARAAEKILLISLGNKGAADVRESDGRKQLIVDLMTEIKRQAQAEASAGLDLRSVRFEAKASVGGAQVMLQVKSRAGEVYADSLRVDTDPVAFNRGEGFKSFELMNRDRNISDVKLVGINALKVRNIRVVLEVPDVPQASAAETPVKEEKPAQMPAAQQPLPAQGQMPVEEQDPFEQGPGVYQPGMDQSGSTEEEEVYDDEEVGSRDEWPVPPAQTPQQPQQGEQTQNARCMGAICMGDFVIQNSTGWEGLVFAIDPRSGRATVRFGVNGNWFVASVPAHDLRPGQ